MWHQWQGKHWLLWQDPLHPAPAQARSPNAGTMHCSTCWALRGMRAVQQAVLTSMQAAKPQPHPPENAEQGQQREAEEAVWPPLCIAATPSVIWVETEQLQCPRIAHMHLPVMMPASSHWKSMLAFWKGFTYFFFLSTENTESPGWIQRHLLRSWGAVVPVGESQQNVVYFL